MTKKQFLKIFEDTDSRWKGDNLVQGIDILRKYYKIEEETIISSASHDQVCSCDIDDIIEKGITEEDVKKLAELNWSCSENDEYLICYV